MKKTLGMMISSLRKDKGMTQLELAEKMGVTEIVAVSYTHLTDFPRSEMQEGSLCLQRTALQKRERMKNFLKKTAFMQSFVRQGFEKGVIMKEIKTENAVGHILCHDITEIVKDERKGVLFHKGHVVREEDIPCLLYTSS